MRPVSLNGKPLQSLNGKPLQSLNGKPLQSLNGKPLQLLNGKQTVDRSKWTHNPGLLEWTEVADR